jgi:hypothetical protein
MNKNGVIAVIVMVAAIVLIGLWAMRSGDQRPAGADCEGPPSAPTDVTADVSGDVVNVRWAAPAEGERVTTYLVEATTDRTQPRTTFVAPGTATSFQRQAPPATYYVTVLARNACGTSDPSSEAVVTVR